MSARSHRMRRLGLLTSAVLGAACGSGQPHPSAGLAGGGAAGSSVGGGKGGGATNVGAAGVAGGGITTIPGGPGCGLGDAAAFCDSFDAPSTELGRAGELDPLKWSAARQEPQAPTAGGVAIGISGATLPSCHAGLPARAFPDQDTLICDPTTSIRSNHLLVAVAAQNYGQNSYRIRQPFDFAGRTGKIVFDAEAYAVQLLGWISIEVSEDPAPGPSFALGSPGTANDEGSVVPRSAFELQFENTCEGQGDPPQIGLRSLIVDQNYVQTESVPSPTVCLKTKQGNLNHFEVSVSQTRIQVYGTAFSPDGATFDKPILLHSADVNLPFSRGYVSITTHNHATLKYTSNPSLDAWVARWDNVGFDGPVISTFREFEIPDSALRTTKAFATEPVSTVAYFVADSAGAPHDTLHFPAVDLSGMKSARLALSTWYPSTATNARYALRYRFNGGTWRGRPLNADEVRVLTDSHCQGALTQVIDVPLTDLVAGANSLEFVSVNIPQSYPPAISNIDLILSQ